STEAIPGSTIAAGNFTTDATTFLGGSETTRVEIATGTTGIVSGKTLEPGNYNTGTTVISPRASSSSPSSKPGTTGEFSRTTIIFGSSYTEATTSVGESGTRRIGITTGTSGTLGGYVLGNETGTTGEFYATTISSGSSSAKATTSTKETGTGAQTEAQTTVLGSQVSGSQTGATTGPSGRPSSGSETGSTGVVSGTTVASGSFNTGATTSLESGGTTKGGIKIVTAGVTTGTTIAPGSSKTRATTLRLSNDTTGSGIQTGTTLISGEVTSYQGVSNSGTIGIGSGITSSPGDFKTRTSGVASGTTAIAGSSNTKATTGVGMQTSTTVESRITAVPESSSPGSTSVSNGMTRSPEVSYPETTGAATGNQETENKTEGYILPNLISVYHFMLTVCHGPLGEEKSPGDIWTANCHRCTCTDANTVDCELQECPSPPTCKTGERLVKFKANDTCCEIGYCEPRTCLFNNTDYEIGDSFDDPNNPCISYSCNDTGFVAVVQDCPKQTWCAEEDRVYDSKKCCYTCKTNCRSSLVNVTLKYNDCKKRVEMARCRGECKKTVKYNYDILENSCLCCREEDYEFRDIVLDCPDGSTIPYRYRHITTCACLDMCQQSMTTVAS
ncbi:hypothetical protein HPG69_015219, partial [Diceros bicornis minor]